MTTRHVSEDTALKLAIGLLDRRVEGRVRHHLEGCTKCSGLLKEADRGMRVIKELTPAVSASIPLLPSLKQNRYDWLRIAAMLAIGFALGFLASEAIRSPSVDVVGQQMLPRPPEIPTVEYVVCNEIDL